MRSLDDALNQARTLNKNAQNEIVMIGGARVFRINTSCE